MLLHIKAVLAAGEVAQTRQALAELAFDDGRATAGQQSAAAKNNLQLDEAAPGARRLGEQVLRAVSASPRFISAALPARIYPPLFNRYGPGMAFGDHVDNAIRVSPVSGGAYRTDLSATLFLSDPDAYDGGELIIGGLGAPSGVKLPAGDLLLYPSSTVHRVAPVTRGERWASIFWVQSMVAGADRRDLLFDLDQAIAGARGGLGDDHAAAVALVGVYHNLVRLWAQV